MLNIFKLYLYKGLNYADKYFSKLKMKIYLSPFYNKYSHLFHKNDRLNSLFNDVLKINQKTSNNNLIKNKIIKQINPNFTFNNS